MHLFCGCKRTLVYHIKPEFSCILTLASGEMGLQGHGFNPGVS